ncbi:DUF6351 family protein [Psychrobium sp. 1_MG-2023]|uniref:DUF6351 family protein n=1 Tax=Psychrobium sp. 1_MG-2023 TaxID=3062624 RepID=UPI000C3366CB|nr:DUF6351 family protein [Psychrobium sp. 1_MG-2023]MDP2559912.1 DUF6351 family protein [Psychrobium sp. 1_MG-2023]PKF58987.1 hypothetical protein CW748_02020 [Alteromonadales bacterium alter-6D02]
MKKLIFIILAMLITTGASIYHFDDDPYIQGQVRGLAIADKASYLLPIKQHISQAKRPQEWYQFPIPLGQSGPSETLYSGPKQYPFYCMSEISQLGQPQVDNHDGQGVAIFATNRQGKKTRHIIGYSKDCAILSQLKYFYRNNQQQLKPYNVDNPPAQQQINQLTIDDKNVNEIYRVEQGTINRFIYTIAMLATGDGSRMEHQHWNKRLIYQFQGGSGIGFRQGKQSAPHLLKKRKEQLQLGYAVISSTANKTSYTYNMLIAEDTAMRVKRHFISLYGKPMYTVGIGGSGGGLSQYLLAQNGTDLLDAAIPLYSYPDMVSQTIYALDCDLLNSYYDFRSSEPELFEDWRLRQAIEGMNARNNFEQKAGFLTPINQIISGRWPRSPTGSSECINGWFGLSTFINNPRQGFLRSYFSSEVVEQVNRNYWEDMHEVYGRTAAGYGASTWDNVGVQYGLNALKANLLSIDEFIALNKNIGSWVRQPQMQPEWIKKIPFTKTHLWLSLWGNKNVTQADNGPAPRHQGDISAMKNAYHTGQVFIGKLNIPTLDIRHYLEEELDMHHMSASFNARTRITNYQGHADNHIIWVSHKDFNPVVKGFKVIDQWLMTKLHNPNLTTTKAKPSNLEDSCFADNGEIIAQGKAVWDGEWNNKALGQCSQNFKMYSNVRIAAGAPWDGSTFKCSLQPVADAIKQSVYGDIAINKYQKQLEEAFPDGVCDYSQGDVGRPTNLTMLALGE